MRSKGKGSLKNPIDLTRIHYALEHLGQVKEELLVLKTIKGKEALRKEILTLHDTMVPRMNQARRHLFQHFEDEEADWDAEDFEVGKSTRVLCEEHIQFRLALNNLCHFLVMLPVKKHPDLKGFTKAFEEFYAGVKNHEEKENHLGHNNI